ncbi:DUF2971 domain-containing protein [Acinetobacter sp. MB5]|uniref:DUF2971 domain-containing protein n=1 Tax=Acinetobacter sp. MB5 TaxID=2069438 RepID=UPI000DD09DE6|nr:DUF2971 domain-containing protein [Acinetobacter sp. MB5]
MNVDDLDLNISLWRYMDFSKFVDLVLNEKIYLSPLRKFEDIYEGHISNVSKKKQQQYVQTLSNYLGYSKKTDEIQAIDEKENDAEKKLVYFAYANCWHSNKYESAAMWRLYAQTNEAIAIKTTLGNLIKAVKPLKSLRADGFFCVKKIEYVDYNDVNSFPEKYNFIQPVSPLCTKRLSFKHENEIRLLYLKSNLLFPPCHPSEKSKIESMSLKDLENMSSSGVNVDINLRDLIEKIYVAPDAPIWFYEMTKEFLKKMNLDYIECEKSSLYELK